MRRNRVLPFVVFLAALLLLIPEPCLCSEGMEQVRKAGWEEGTPGRWNSLPARKAEAAGDTFRAEIVLAPGTGVLWEKGVNRPLRPDESLSIEMVSTGTNRSSRDYLRHKARFPLAVTAVFGKDSVDLPWKKRLAEFFRAFWHGVSSRGIRLTFAYGNVVPVGSMYRLGEEETVFVLAGQEERGKKIDVTRDLRADFRAAYGRDPRGPVTRILVSAQRPSGEDGPIDATLRITSPLLR